MGKSVISDSIPFSRGLSQITGVESRLEKVSALKIDTPSLLKVHSVEIDRIIFCLVVTCVKLGFDEDGGVIVQAGRPPPVVHIHGGLGRPPGLQLQPDLGLHL